MIGEDVSFPSGNDTCAAWLYRPDPASLTPCIVMAHGFSMTRHDGLETYAEALAAAGVAVLVFDHRYLGDSGGQPRQHFRIKKQAQDYVAAVAYARGVAGVDPEQIVLWGFSFSGDTAVNVAAQDPRIVGVMLLCPFLDGRARVIGTVHQTPLVAVRMLLRAIKDLAGSDALIPVTGQPGELTARAFHGEAEGFATVALHRPVTKAARAELHRYDVDHFEPFYGTDPATIAAAQVEWLTRIGLAA